MAPEKSTTRARWFLRIGGIVFLLIAAYVWKNPAHSPDHAMPLCLILGGSLWAIGQFASDAVVNRVEQLITGW